MTSLPELLQQGSAHAWLFIPTAILLGALHGLEPGHSKTMMAAFIVAVRGTVSQAVLLGVSAAISHTAVVWVVALGGQYLGRGMDPETTEPYFQVASAVIVIGIALLMLWRTWRDQRLTDDHTDHPHGDVRRIDTGHGLMTLAIQQHEATPHFRISFEGRQTWSAEDIELTVARPDRATQNFSFVQKADYLESHESILEPHDFAVKICLGHGGHTHDYEVIFSDHAHHHAAEGLRVGQDGEHMDAHARAHAKDIARRFSEGKVTTGQIIIFGLTGGLIPCPAAITVLLLCLQLQQVSLGVVLVICFSIGLAVTMVSAGVVASLSVNHVRKRWSGFDKFASRAPYASGVLMLLIALYMGYTGMTALNGNRVAETAAISRPSV